ncbi:hypothetical protein LSTR_LSTR012674 [Laodelphax striatellus]|uniref:Uncharacterized protein n=1 Tax=Laodelphax striatellus TaxID=195883 RepID=A0A482XIS9_LAOST|nr:hypothetical protein LSTR_LSTR012674 [Laodelphax striatellus]
MTDIKDTLPAKRRQEHECSASTESIKSVKRHESIERVNYRQATRRSVSGSWLLTANGVPTGWLLSRIRCLQNSDKNMSAVQAVGALDQSKDMNKSQLQTGYQEISISKM